jgi:transcriptional regulator with XRE-family HTH domain
MMVGMATRTTRLERADANARAIVDEAMREFDSARLALGLSMADVGGAVGMSRSQVGRLVRREIPDVSVRQICRLHAAVGLTDTMRAFPAGDPLRDAGQVRLLDRTHVRVAPAVAWHVERGVTRPGDLRAWDVVLDGHGCVDAIEAITRFGDAQALQRRAMQKLRDDPTVRHLFLVIADTRLNRSALEACRESMRSDFPLDTRALMTALGQGRCPGASGIAVV